METKTSLTPTFSRCFRWFLSWRNFRRVLMVAITLVTLYAVFCTVEHWRGKRAWETVKNELEAKGEMTDWAGLIPAPIPDEQNFFKAPHMASWFTGRGTKPDPKDVMPGVFCPTDNYSPAKPVSELVVIADVQVVQPGSSAIAENIDVKVTEADPDLQAKIDEGFWKKRILYIRGPYNFYFSSGRTNPVDPLRIQLVTGGAPETNIFGKMFGQHLKFEPDKDGATHRWQSMVLVPVQAGHYELIMNDAVKAADFLACDEQYQNAFDAVRTALKRPLAQIDCSYEKPAEITIVNFVNSRTLSHALVQRAQCHLLLGQSDKALEDLTLLHDFTRIFAGKPQTLVASMIDVAITGLYLQAVNDGLKIHAWNDAQLATLQQQIKEIHLLPLTAQSIKGERIFSTHTFEHTTYYDIKKLLRGRPKSKINDCWEHLLSALQPRGWVYQNMALTSRMIMQLDSIVNEDCSIAYAEKADTAQKKMTALLESKASSPYGYLAGFAVPNFSRAIETTSQNESLAHWCYIACGLERYRLAHDDYPEMLEALVPQFAEKIPHGVINGATFPYHRTSKLNHTLEHLQWTWSKQAATSSFQYSRH